MENTDKYKSPGKHWPAFAKKLRRLIGDAIRLWRRQDELSPEQYASRRERIDKRLAELIDTPWKDTHAKRLIKRLKRHPHHLFTFLSQEGVPFDNNHAERSIRPAVIIRKNSYGNRSQRGADGVALMGRHLPALELELDDHVPVDHLVPGGGEALSGALSRHGQARL